MKLTILAFFLGLMGLSASTYSQKTKLTIDLIDVSVSEIFKAIESNSEFVFIYENSALNLDRKISITEKECSIDRILKEVLEGTGADFEIVEKQIVISNKNNPPVPLAILKSKFETESQQPQKKEISGLVIDSKGITMPGVSVVVKGSNTGIITDTNGHFTLKVPLNAQILIFSFIGMKTQELVIGTKNVFNVTMVEDKVVVDEVVVTALGIVKSKKSLTYSTQQVDMDDLTTVKNLSLGDALAGKVAGISITSSAGTTGVSGDPRIIIRGDRSINGNNQPLIVVDGIPYSTGGGGLSSINPDDIQSLNVLKGPAASALYGSSANNGVIVVTTKMGKSGESKIEVNSTSNFDLPYLYPAIQNEYGQGMSGSFQPNAELTSWGPKMTGQTVTDWTGKQTTLTPQPNNIKDFFGAGFNTTNNISYSTGNDKSSAYFSYANTAAQGILKDNKMERNSFNLRLTTEVIKNLKLDFKITYFNQILHDQPVNGDDLFSPMFQLIRMPRSLRTADIKKSSYYDLSGSLKQSTWAPGSTAIINPYWARDGYENPSTSNSINTMLMLKYDFNKWLYLQVRGVMGNGSSDYEKRTYWDTPYVNSGKGEYTTSFSKGKSMNGDVLLGFNKDLVKDLHLSVNLGAEIKDSQGRSLYSNAGGLSNENKFEINFGKQLTVSGGDSRIQKQSVYGMTQLGYKNYIFLDVTARNDWSSTLPKPYKYFYPSVGLSGIVSDMVKLPEWFSYAKVRGSYAEVGNDAGFAMIFQTYGRDASGPAGTVYPQGTKMPVNLIPEKTKSWEIGSELRFLENRLSFDFTWYKSNTYNQLLQVTSPPSSGYGSSWINTGNIQNTGVELMISGTPIKKADFKWNLDLNFSRNKNKIIELTKTLKRYEISSPNLSVGETWAVEGRPFGEIFTRGFVRNDAGKVLVDALGMPRIMSNFDLVLGNFNYDWRSGITNNFQYKNWYMSFLIDLNYGGVRQSATEAQMIYSGTSIESLYGREGGFIYPGVKDDGTPNDILITAQAFAQSVGGRISNGAGEPFNHSATNSRIRELSIGYSIPLHSNVVKALRISVVGRNLFYLYNGCKWFDPDTTYDTSTNGQGAESGFLPGSRTLGVNIKLTL